MPHVDKRKENILMREMLQHRIVSATKTKKDGSSGIMTSKEERMLLRDMTRDVSQRYKEEVSKIPRYNYDDDDDDDDSTDTNDE